MRSDLAHTIGSPGLAAGVVRFADFLKARGFRIFQSSVRDALLGLSQLDLAGRDDFRACLRATFVKTDLEWGQFEALFEEFWRGHDEERPGDTDEASVPERSRPRKESPDADARIEISGDAAEDREDIERKEWFEGVAYSPLSCLEKKDLARFDKADIQVAHLALKRMMEPFRIQRSRRRRRSPRHAEMDFPRVIRKSLRTGGMPFELLYREKKKRLKHLVILSDVSGSMDRYARFVMPFLLGLRGVASRAEVFVFSTALASISFFVRHLSVDKALERISEEVPDWSGGTRIGYSLHQFNHGPGHRLLSGRTVVVILSDGWDLGAKDLLRREMEFLSRRAHCVVWLNPLAGDPAYESLSHGMRVVLPLVDYHLPADSLQSLRRVGRLLQRLMVH